MSARWGSLCKYLMSNHMNLLESIHSPHRGAENLNFCFRMRSGSCGYAAQQRPLPVRLFDPILPEAWYILHVFQSKCYDWILALFTSDHFMGIKKKKNPPKTISKIILVHSPGMLYNKSIINEDIRSDLHFPPPRWFSSVPTAPPPQLPLTTLLSLLSLTDSPLASPSSSPQEGEADGGSGKIRWAEDGGGEAVRERGSHMSGGRLIDGGRTTEEKKGARKRGWSNDGGEMTAGSWTEEQQGRGRGMQEEKPHMQLWRKNLSINLNVWYVLLWELCACVLCDHNSTSALRVDIVIVLHPKTWEIKRLHTHTHTHTHTRAGPTHACAHGCQPTYAFSLACSRHARMLLNTLNT